MVSLATIILSWVASNHSMLASTPTLGRLQLDLVCHPFVHCLLEMLGGAHFQDSALDDPKLSSSPYSDFRLLPEWAPWHFWYRCVLRCQGRLESVPGYRH